MGKYILPELAGDKQAEEPVGACAICGRELYAGENLYQIAGLPEYYCDECLDEFEKTLMDCVILG